MVTTPNQLLANPPLENGDMPTVLAVLQAGLNSAAHQSLVQQLTEGRGETKNT